MMVDAMNLFLFCWQTLEKEIIFHTRRPWWRPVWRRQSSTKRSCWNTTGIGIIKTVSQGKSFTRKDRLTARCAVSTLQLDILITVEGNHETWWLHWPVYLLSPSTPVSGERRFWMMSRITLPPNPISGCHPVSETSWGRKKRSSESFGMPLARTGRSHWTLPAAKWRKREQTWTNTTTSKLMWRGFNQSCKNRFMLCSHDMHLWKCLQSFAGWMRPSSLWVTTLCQTHRSILTDLVESRAAESWSTPT